MYYSQNIYFPVICIICNPWYLRVRKMVERCELRMRTRSSPGEVCVLLMVCSSLCTMSGSMQCRFGCSIHTHASCSFDFSVAGLILILEWTTEICKMDFAGIQECCVPCTMQLGDRLQLLGGFTWGFPTLLIGHVISIVYLYQGQGDSPGSSPLNMHSPVVINKEAFASSWLCTKHIILYSPHF